MNQEAAEQVTGLAERGTSEIVGAAAILVVAIIGMIGSLQAGVGWEHGPTSGFFPFFMALAIAIAQAIVLLEEFAKKRASSEAQGYLFKAKNEPIELMRVGIPVILATYGILVLGFYMMSFFYFTLFAIWHGKVRWYWGLLGGLIIISLSYWMFQNMFHIWLPKSMIYSDTFPL